MSPPPAFLDDLSRFIDTHGLIAAGEKVLVGVSGGLDSTVLLHALVRLGYRVAAAHVDYGLRGAASQDDAAFVAALCERMKVPLHAVRLDAAAHAGAHRQSLQTAARELRYGFFAEVAEAEGITKVAVGHHRDDQAETLLLNLFRGCGPEGLAAMRPSRQLADGSKVWLLRPLLGVRRAEIEAFARAEGIGWREDASNAAAKYRRSAVRHEILPLIERHFGTATTENICHAADLLREYADALRDEVAASFYAAAGKGEIQLDELETHAPVWQRRLILEALARWLPGAPRTAAVAEEIAALLDAGVGARVVFGAGTVWRERDALVFTPDDAEETVPVDGGSLQVDLLDTIPADLTAGAPHTIYADADRLAFPLTLRPWRHGDHFQPFGMDGTKSVSDFLTDAKTPVHRREAVRVLVSAGEIVWIVGYRLSERFKVDPATRRVAVITLNGA